MRENVIRTTSVTSQQCTFVQNYCSFFFLYAWHFCSMCLSPSGYMNWLCNLEVEGSAMALPKYDDCLTPFQLFQKAIHFTDGRVLEFLWDSSSSSHAWHDTTRCFQAGRDVFLTLVFFVPKLNQEPLSMALSHHKVPLVCRNIQMCNMYSGEQVGQLEYLLKFSWTRFSFIYCNSCSR